MILHFFRHATFPLFFFSFSFPGSGWAKRMKNTYTHGAPQAWFGFDTMFGSFGLSGTSRSFSGRSSGVFDVTQAHFVSHAFGGVSGPCHFWSEDYIHWEGARTTAST